MDSDEFYKKWDKEALSSPVDAKKRVEFFEDVEKLFDHEYDNREPVDDKK
jgi:hypothetical protein